MKVYLGTEIKLNLNIEKIGSHSMSDYDFTVEVFCNPTKKLTIEKDNPSLIKKDDDDNYILLIDTETIGIGKVKLQVTAHIPDQDFPDQLRTEVQIVNTDIEVIKRVI